MSQIYCYELSDYYILIEIDDDVRYPDILQCSKYHKINCSSSEIECVPDYFFSCARQPVAVTTAIFHYNESGCKWIFRVVGYFQLGICDDKHCSPIAPKALRCQSQQRPRGWCGVWMHSKTLESRPRTSKTLHDIRNQ